MLESMHGASAHTYIWEKPTMRRVGRQDGTSVNTFVGAHPSMRRVGR
jgi:hypothetical protein